MFSVTSDAVLVFGGTETAPALCCSLQAQKDYAWKSVEILADNCADDHVCPLNAFQWVKLDPGVDPRLETASGEALAHYGQRTVKLYLSDYRPVTITFQVCSVHRTILSVGKFCAQSELRSVVRHYTGGTLHHESSRRV